MKFLTLCVVILFSVSAYAASSKEKPAAKEKTAAPLKAPQIAPAKMVERVQKAWDDTTSYQASFKQVVFSKRIGDREESQGTIYVSKPNRLRWESKTDGTIQIMNENKLWVVHHNKRRETTVVDVYSDLKKAVDVKPLAFLSGKAKFKDIYKVELLSETTSAIELKFTALTNASETLVAEVGKDSYLLRSLTSETVDSRTRTEFSNIKQNVKLEEKLFTYVPAPTDVIHNN